MNEIHLEIVQKAMDLLQANLSQPISLPELAKKMGYSPSHLRWIFRKATGKGILPHLYDLRMERAKKLLRETRLTVTEIGFETGFGSHKCFCTAFKKKIGCTPGAFRRSQGTVDTPNTTRVARENSMRSFYESFAGPVLPAQFGPFMGSWQQQNGVVEGYSTEAAYLQFKKPLPENFHVRFQARLFREKGLLSTEIGISLAADNPLNSYYEFMLGRAGGAYGEFRAQGTPLLFDATASPKQEEWHTLDLELVDDEVSLSINGKKVFAHRDPFPPPYARRCNLYISTTDGKIGLREFEVFDRGFLPLIKNVRQGDALFGSGLFSSARDFYTRLLASKTSTTDIIELRYKIGLCFAREENTVQARHWLEKIVAVPGTEFWAARAKLASLEIEAQEDRVDQFLSTFLLLFKTNTLEHEARQIMFRARDDYAQRGFFEKAYLLGGQLQDAERPDSFLQLQATAAVAEILRLLRRLDESEGLFRLVTDHPFLPERSRAYALFSLCDTLGAQGKNVEWKGALDELEKRVSSSPTDACRLLIYRAVFCRAQGDLTGALEYLSQVPEKTQPDFFWPAFAKLHSGLILCCQGKYDAAQDVFDEAERLDPNNVWLAPGRVSRWHYPLEMARGNWETAARFLLDDSEANRGSSEGAEQSIKAGILMAIAGENDRAKEVWKRTGRLFPPQRINFYGSLAQDLAINKLESTYDLPYPVHKRSELFYLLGLLCEGQNEPARARMFYERCISEDKLLHWPAYMAKKKLDVS